MKCARCGLDIAAPPCPRCLLLAPIEETRFGPHFVLGEELGKGGMGTVLRARDTRIDRDCALKLLDVRVGDEAKTLARVRHPNIVTLYEAGEIDGQPYIAMELVEGKTLGRLAPRDAVRVGIALCDALVCAHSAGVVHRDIKPSNVLVTPSGEIKLTDFGIATTERTPEVQAATPGFAPPDLTITPKSDLFSLGVLLFQCVTGELPAGDMKRLPWPLDGVVRRATAQDPALRFSDAVQMKRALEDTARAMDAATLPPDEQNWVRAVALLFTAATALGLWTLLQSISPVVVDGENIYPLARMALRKLADGRYVSLARLEVGPALATLASFAAAFFAYGLLRRHWRVTGLEEPRPDRPVPESKQVMRIALFAVLVFLLRRAAMAFGIPAVAMYVPVIGGMLELVILYGLSLALLECVRTQRPVTREWRMWVAFWIALLLPGLELLTYINSLEFN